MRKVISRYGKRIMSFMCALVVLAGSVCLFSFESKAASYEFTTNFMEPTLDDYSGYMAVNNNGKLYVYVWRIIPDDANNTSEMHISVFTDHISFNPQVSNSGSGYFSLWVLNPSGNESCAVTTSISGSSYYKSIDNLNVLGYSFRGNYSYVNANVHSSVSVTWGENALLYETLQALIDELRSNGSSSSELLSAVEEILLQVDDTEEALYKISDVLVTKLDSILEQLKSGQTQVDERLLSILNCIAGIRGILNNIDMNVDTIMGTVEYITTLLEQISAMLEEKIDKTNNYLYNIHNRLKELLNIQGEHTEEDKVVDGSQIGDISKIEGDLLFDTSDFENSLQVEINPGFGSITDLVTRLVTFDSRIFAFFLTMLTLGTVSLILGR